MLDYTLPTPSIAPGRSSTAFHRRNLNQEPADGGRRTVVLVQAGAGADEVGPSSVVLLEERGRRRDEGEVELNEGLLVEVRERLLEEVDPARTHHHVHENGRTRQHHEWETY